MATPAVSDVKAALDRLRQEAVVVTFDPDGASELHVFVRGGVQFSANPQLAVSDIDLVGTYDLISTTADETTLSFVIPEESVDVLDVLFPEGTDGTAARYFGRMSGHGQRQHALKVRIVPWSEKASLNEYMTLWKVVKAGEVSNTRNVDNPHGYQVNLRALPDLDQADGSLIGYIKAQARS